MAEKKVEYQFISQSFCSWGIGKTIAEADANMREAAGYRYHKKEKLTRILFRINPEKTKELFIDDLGRLNFVGEEPLRIEKAAV